MPRHSNPWWIQLPPGAALQSWVVVALDQEAGRFLSELSQQSAATQGIQLVVVCCASATLVASIPQWVTVVPVPDHSTEATSDARTLGLAQALGDVVHLVTTAELASEQGWDALAWADRLLHAGAVRPDPGGGSAQ